MTSSLAKHFLMLVLGAPLLLSAACNRPNSGSNVVITPEAKAEAESIFASRCMTCHGLQGTGDGPASAALSPKPRNFHDKTWQSNVTDRHIETIIQFGGTSVGKSPAMPPNPDLASKPAVVAGLRAYVRDFGK
jgi:mono/diheme cytochrome c family protein